jgi:hypothetical protein
VNPWLSIEGGLSIQLSNEESKTQVVNPGPTDPDTELMTEGFGIGAGGLLSVMIELTDQTRFAITRHSETEPEESPDVKLRNSTLSPSMVDAINSADNDVNVRIRGRSTSTSAFIMAGATAGPPPST